MRAPLISAVFLIAMAPAAWADETGWGEGVEVIDAKDMDALRGGFEVAGIEINFGATVTTLVNGVPALTTTLTWTDVGAVVDETIGELGQDVSAMSPEQLATLGLDGLEGAGGIVIADEAGVTALVHNITEGALQNIIINNATGRDLVQDIDVTLTLPGFELIQNALMIESLGIQVDAELGGFLYDPGG
ncbi:MAG: hypothetical protein AB7T59_19270 [Hyphomonadaceae bacterium]